MTENRASKGRTRNGARGGHGHSRMDDRSKGFSQCEGLDRSCPASRSLDRVQRFYTDPAFQVPSWQPRD